MEINRKALGRMKGISLPERVFLLLRDAISQGTIAGRERLIEHAIAGRLGISRTPVREALKKLENEGLVTLTHNKGAQVNSISLDDVEEIYKVVGVLEGLAAFLALGRMEEKNITKLKGINQELQERNYRNPQDYLDKDRQFHSVYLSKCGNKRLMKIVHKELKAINRYRLLSHSIPRRVKEALEQHEAIIRAFKSANGRRVRSAVENHIFRGGQILKEYLQKYGSP